MTTRRGFMTGVFGLAAATRAQAAVHPDKAWVDDAADMLYQCAYGRYLVDDFMRDPATVIAHNQTGYSRNRTFMSYTADNKTLYVTERADIRGAMRSACPAGSATSASCARNLPLLQDYAARPQPVMLANELLHYRQSLAGVQDKLEALITRLPFEQALRLYIAMEAASDVASIRVAHDLRDSNPHMREQIRLIGLNEGYEAYAGTLARTGDQGRAAAAVHGSAQYAGGAWYETYLDIFERDWLSTARAGSNAVSVQDYLTALDRSLNCGAYSSHLGLASIQNGQRPRP